MRSTLQWRKAQVGTISGLLTQKTLSFPLVLFSTACVSTLHLLLPHRGFLLPADGDIAPARAVQGLQRDDVALPPTPGFRSVASTSTTGTGGVAAAYGSDPRALV